MANIVLILVSLYWQSDWLLSLDFPFQMLALQKPYEHLLRIVDTYIWFHPPPEYQDIFCQFHPPPE